MNLNVNVSIPFHLKDSVNDSAAAISNNQDRDWTSEQVASIVPIPYKNGDRYHLTRRYNSSVGYQSEKTDGARESTDGDNSLESSDGGNYWRPEQFEEATPDTPDGSQDTHMLKARWKSLLFAKLQAAFEDMCLVLLAGHEVNRFVLYDIDSLLQDLKRELNLEPPSSQDMSSPLFSGLRHDRRGCKADKKHRRGASTQPSVGQNFNRNGRIDGS